MISFIYLNFSFSLEESAHGCSLLLELITPVLPSREFSETRVWVLVKLKIYY